jgi:hypothetical protein
MTFFNVFVRISLNKLSSRECVQTIKLDSKLKKDNTACAAQKSKNPGKHRPVWNLKLRIHLVLWCTAAALVA